MADNCNTDYFDRFLRNCYRRSMPLQIFDSIAENDLISDSATSPWLGYLWNSAEQRYEWLLLNQNAQRVSIVAQTQRRELALYPAGWLRLPGNNLLRVRIYDAFLRRANHTCITESATAEAEKIGMRYSPAIGPVPTDPNKWHCVDSPRNFETIKGPAYSAPPSRR